MVTTTATLTGNQTVLSIYGVSLLQFPQLLRLCETTDTIALIPTSPGKIQGPVLGPGVVPCPSPIAGGIRTTTLAGTTDGTSLYLILTDPVPRTNPRLTTPGIGTNSPITGNPGHTLEGKDSLLSSFSSHEEFGLLDYWIIATGLKPPT